MSISPANREHLKNLAISNVTAIHCIQLEDGSRAFPEGVPPYPRYSELPLPSKIYGSLVDNISPFVREVFKVLRKDKAKEMNIRLGLRNPVIPGNGPLTNVLPVSMDLPNIVERFRQDILGSRAAVLWKAYVDSFGRSTQSIDAMATSPGCHES